MFICIFKQVVGADKQPIKELCKVAMSDLRIF